MTLRSLELRCADDVSHLVILLEANPYFWGGKSSSNGSSSTGPDHFTFDRFLEHVSEATAAAVGE